MESGDLTAKNGDLMGYIYCIYIYTLVGGLEPWIFMTFHSVGNFIPIDELHHFSEG